MGVKNSDIRISRNDGIAAWGTIVSFAESAKPHGVLYAGSDDGNLHVTRDAARTGRHHRWFPACRKSLFVSELVPSRFDEATVYATLDGHRNNNFEPRSTPALTTARTRTRLRPT